MTRSNFLASIAAIFLAPFVAKSKPSPIEYDIRLPATMPKPFTFGYATSKDGITWTKVSSITDVSVDAPGWDKEVISDKEILFTWPDKNL